MTNKIPTISITVAGLTTPKIPTTPTISITGVQY